MQYLQTSSAAARSRFFARPWGVLAMGLIVSLALLTLAFGQSKRAAVAADAKPDAAPGDADTIGPSITIDNLKADVWSDDKIKQRLSAEWGRLDETENIFDMRNLNMSFYANGEYRAGARSGSGRVWTKERKKEGIGANDMLLSEGVRFSTSDGSLVISPQMHFYHSRGMLNTDQGYKRQTKTGDAYWFDQGTSCTIKIDLATSAVESFSERGGSGPENALVTVDNLDKAPIQQ